MRGLSEVKRLLLGGAARGVSALRQLDEALAGGPRPPDARQQEMPLVLAEAAPGVDADPADLDGFDLSGAASAVLRDVHDLHDHPVIDGELQELLDLVLRLRSPSIEEAEVTQSRH